MTVTLFPLLEIDLKDKIVISNMSLGYFNSEKMGITNQTICSKLKECSHLYIATTNELISLLRPYFKEIEYFKKGNYPRCYLRK